MAKKIETTLQELTVQNPTLQIALAKFEGVKQQLDERAKQCLLIKVTDEASLSVCEHNLTKMNDLIKSVEKFRKDEKQPYLDKGRAIDSAAAYVSEFSEESLKHLKSEKIAWIRLKDAERKAKEEEAAAMIEMGIEPAIEESPIELEVISRVRRYWKHEVVNIADVPREFLMIDDSKVKEWMSSQNGNLVDGGVVNGIKFFKDISVTA